MVLARYAFLAGLFFVSAVSAADRVVLEASLPFDMTKDALCFRNGDPDLAKTGIPVLGRLGMKKGVCQGIAGISAAFRENVDFVPNAPADPGSEIPKVIARAVSANRERTRERIQVRGFASLKDLCAANRTAFLRKAVWLNLQIGAEDIVPLLPEFERVKKRPIGTEKHPEALRRELGASLATALSELREGRYPLILYFSHVVAARAYREVVSDDGARRVEIEIYDSNHLEAFRTLSIRLGSDGLPTAENSMLWVLEHRPN